MSNDERNEGGGPLEYDEHGIPILNVRARLSEVERKATEAETRDQNYKTRQETINRRLMIFTGLLVLTSLISGGIAIWQTRITNRSAKAAESAAKTAAKALEDAEKPTSDVHISAVAAKSAADTADATLKSSQKSFEIDQRPYLVVEGTAQFVQPGPIAYSPIEANLFLKNIGKTPALTRVTNINMLSHHAAKTKQGYIAFIESTFSDLMRKDERGRKESETLKNLSAEQDTAPGDHFFATNPQVVMLTDTEMPQLKTGEVAIYFVGIVSYKDSFGSSYQTQFCFFYFGSNPAIWHICDSHNIIR